MIFKFGLGVTRGTGQIIYEFILVFHGYYSPITISTMKRSRYWSQIAFFHTPVRYGKLEWRGYPMVKKCEDIFIRFDRIHEHDGHQDGRMDRWTTHDISRA